MVGVADGDTRQPVLGHLDAGAGAAHRAPQVGQFGHGEAAIMRDDNQRIGEEVRLQRINGLRLLSPIH